MWENPLEVYGKIRSVMPLDSLGCTRITMERSKSNIGGIPLRQASSRLLIFEISSCLGLNIAIIVHKRGISSKCSS